ncbi:Uncharacterised protein [Mycobacteroides abscessus subsp. abscessus]|nr:Uncharacterised protein [Mycobacteroides abscessus subsp. abscessus]
MAGAVAAHVDAGLLPGLHRVHHPIASRAPGFRAQPFVPVRASPQGFEPVGDIEPVAALRCGQAPARHRVHAVERDHPGLVAGADRLDRAQPAVPLIPATALDDVLHHPGQHRGAAPGHRPQVARDLLDQPARAGLSRILDHRPQLVVAEQRVLIRLVEVPFAALGVGPGRARRRRPEQLGIGQGRQVDGFDVAGRKMLGVREVQCVDLHTHRVVVGRQPQLDAGNLLPAQRIATPTGEVDRGSQRHPNPHHVNQIRVLSSH